MNKIHSVFIFVASCCMACQSTSTHSDVDTRPVKQEEVVEGLTYADSLNSGIIPLDTLKRSPHRVTNGTIGLSKIHIEYGSPGVKGRIIWGGLVPFRQVWVAGAHAATSISFSKEVIIGDKTIAPGKYAFFAIPDSSEWILLLNRNFRQHLADDYKMEEDVVRVAVKPVVSDSSVQRLTYSVKEPKAGIGEIQLQWERIKVAMIVKGN